MKKVLAIVITLALVLMIPMLSGCGNKAINGALSKANEQQDSVNNNNNSNDNSSNDSNNSSQNDADSKPAINWPGSWPGEVPKLEGKATYFLDLGFANKAGGLMVNVTVANMDAVKKYGDQLVSSGYTKTAEITASDTYTATYDNKKFSLMTTYTNDSNEAQIVLTQTQP